MESWEECSRRRGKAAGTKLLASQWEGTWLGGGTARKAEHWEWGLGEEGGPQQGRHMCSLVDRARAFVFYSEATEEF